MSVYRLEEMFPQELEARVAEAPILVLPFGTVEWHSHHLPVRLDGLVAQALGEAIAEASGGVLAPVSYWAAGGVPFPFTLRLTPQVIEPLLRAVFEQFASMGFRVVVGLTGHFGLDQTLILKRAALEAMRATSAAVLPLTEYDLTTDQGYDGDHAALGETSLLAALRPDLVRLDARPAGQPLEGIIGEDPRGKATPEFGARLKDLIATRGTQFARRLLAAPEEREEFMAALEAGVRVLEQTAQQRRVLPKSQVPPVVTPAYRAYCQALFGGDYPAARRHAGRKLANLAE